MNVVYGISCDAFVAKAKGVALVPDVGVGITHRQVYHARLLIDRTLPEFQISVQLIVEAFVLARINPVSVAADGSVYH
ncbi:Uncharacterised protein [Escherichia coli]|uniref:Uncharacterized protein n=1 Tax=Escherichia coli TaxID=562 RepID=A0A2X1LF39_ECOLX|nr:Uncharacterised protein [Escherichia coli]